MTTKEAINVMTQAMEEAGQAFLGKVQFNVPQYHAVIKALEKQIPKKPKENLDGNLACQCGFVIQNGKNRKCIYYCTYCGQRLDWGEEE